MTEEVLNLRIKMWSRTKFSKDVAYFLVSRGYKTKLHWSKLTKKNGPTDKALEHFDEFYGSVFGNRWQQIRKALLRKPKYVALVNNFGDTEATINFLQQRGAHDMNRLIEVQRNFQELYESEDIQLTSRQSSSNSEDLLTQTVKNLADNADRKEISRLYPSGRAEDYIDDKEHLDVNTNDSNQPTSKILASDVSLEKSLSEVDLDESRLIEPSLGMSASTLWQYIPATKIKGMNDWIPESQHYQYMTGAKDFPLTVELEDSLGFPDHLKVYTFEDENATKFPEPKRCTTGVYNYYPMDGASVMCVLALGLQGGERVLDLCSAPGGKALVALQTLLPDVLVANDRSFSRANRISGVFRDYLHDYEISNKWQERVIITKIDGRDYKEEQLYDKVLVDVPCTTDRHSVIESDNNIFRQDRIKERLKIPELQAQLLANALSLVKVDGTVVYSTCTLSPIQNDGVVHMALKNAFEQFGIMATIKDLTECMLPYRVMYRFGLGRLAPRYGQLITPHVAANFGPMYFSKIVRTR